MDIIYIVLGFISIVILICFIFVFIMYLIIKTIEHFPMKRITELEKQIVILEEAFKIKYPQIFKEHQYMFDDEEREVTITKRVLKMLYVEDEIWHCNNVSFNQQLQACEQCHKKCTSRLMKFCSGILTYVHQRYYRALGIYNNIKYLYDPLKTIK